MECEGRNDTSYLAQPAPTRRGRGRVLAVLGYRTQGKDSFRKRQLCTPGGINNKSRSQNNNTEILLCLSSLHLMFYFARILNISLASLSPAPPGRWRGPGARLKMAAEASGGRLATA